MKKILILAAVLFSTQQQTCCWRKKKINPNEFELAPVAGYKQSEKNPIYLEMPADDSDPLDIRPQQKHIKAFHSSIKTLKEEIRHLPMEPLLTIEEHPEE